MVVSMNRREDMLRHFPTLLRRWRGYPARLVELTRSHQTLEIELRDSVTGYFMSIGCIAPLAIQSPVEWENAEIEVALHPNGFVVRDRAAHIEIVAVSVEINEHGLPPNETRRESL
jgi:hypothetical protein